MEELEKIIKEFLESDLREIDINMFPIKTFMETFGKLGYDWDENIVKNGFAVDFWLTFEQGDEQIGLSGSWWNGNYNLEKLWM